MRSAPAGFGFDDQGERVPTVMPEVLDDDEERQCSEEDAARLRQETIRRYTAWLNEHGHAEFIGRKSLVVGYLLGSPRTLDELAARMGVTKGRASQIVSELNAELASFAGVLG